MASGGTEARLQRIEDKLDEMGSKFDRLLAALEGKVDDETSKLVGELRKEVEECRKTAAAREGEASTGEGPAAGSEGEEPAPDKEPAEQEAGGQGAAEVPAGPRPWGMTAEQLYEIGIEVFGSPRAVLEACASGAMYAALSGESMRELGGPQGMAMYDVVAKFVRPKAEPPNLSLAVYMSNLGGAECC